MYEKALPAALDWTGRLAAAAQAGYDFVEISIDESEERLARLDWGRAQRQDMRRILADAPASIDTMCLSAHRKYSMGSVCAPLRQQAMDIMRKAIDLSAEIGVRILQVAGYDVFYEPSTEHTRALYRAGILQSAEWARQACVMLALENVDCAVVDSVEKGMAFVKAAATPWFQMYPDIGNLTAMQKDVLKEIRAGAGNIVGVHLKDTRVGEMRRVPLGGGLVDFAAAFRTLREIDFRGPFVVEMWNEADADPVAVVSEARKWLAGKLAEAGG